MTAYTPKTFTFGRQQAAAKVLTPEEHESADKALAGFSSKSAAVQFLVKRGWSTSQICQKIRYDDGRELRPQHVNQIKAKMRD